MVGRLKSASWPLGFAVAAVVVFVFYVWLLPHLGPGVNTWFGNWLTLNQISLSLIWAMSALGLNIVVGYAGLLDLGYVAFWAIGGYATAWLMSFFITGVHIDILGNQSKGTTTGIHMNWVLVLICAALLCALFGVIIGAPTLRLRGDYLALVTMAAGYIIPRIFHNGDKNGIGINLTNGTLGIGPVDYVKGVKVNNGNLSWGNLLAFDDTGRYVYFVLLTAVIIFISLRIRHGRLGRAWLAIREDELAANAMGISLINAKLSAYAIGAAAGGFCGVAYALQLGTILPDPFTFSVSIILLAMVVLGGMGNVWGVLLGALVLSWFNSAGLPQIGKSVNGTFGTNIDFPSFSYLIFGGALVLMMLFRREGFLPETRTRAVLHEGRADDSQGEEPTSVLVAEAEHEGGAL